MKKMIMGLLVFGFLALLGCENGTDSTSKFTPPSWIYGTWNDTTGNITYTFSSDNIVSIMSSITVDFKTVYASVTVTEDPKTDNEYKVMFSASGQEYDLRFVKLTATTVNYWNTSVGPIELTKQQN